MIGIINPFTTTGERVRHYSIYNDKPVFTYGEYAIYNFGVSYVYTFKNLAFNELVGKNIEHLNNVANRTPPSDKNFTSTFLYNRAIETLTNNTHLIK